MKTLTEDDKGIICRALSAHYHSLIRARNRCVGSLYPGIYAGEANRTEALLKKLLGNNEEVLSK